MNARISDHTNGQTENPGANAGVRARVQSKLRKNGNGQSIVGKKLSAGIMAALDDTYFKATNGAPATAASATNVASIAIGNGANANPGAGGYGATAIGNSASALGGQTTAIGSTASATGAYAAALGNGTKAAGSSSVAVGSLADASASGAIAIGLKAKANTGSSTDGNGNIVIGANAVVDNTGAGAVVIGRNAKINNSGGDGAGAMALGDGANVYGNDSMAMGHGAQSNGAAALAAGSNADARGPGSMALGEGATTYSSAGEVKYASLAMGASSGSQGWGTTAISAFAQATGTWSTALGSTSTASGVRSVALGASTIASGLRSVALGMGSVADRDGTVSVGGGETVSRQVVNMAPGKQALDAVNINQLSPLVTALNATFNASTGAVTGPSYTVQGQIASTVGSALGVLDTNLTTAKDDIATLQANGVSMPYVKVKSTGPAASATGADAIAIGNAAQSSQTNNIALGNGAQALANNDAVAIGAGSLADVASTVSIGNRSTALTRRLVNVKAGAQTTDAVNVGQLRPVMTALGGGAAIDPATGAVTGPTYTLANGGVQTTLSGALSALDRALSDVGGSDNPYLAFNSTGPAALAAGDNAIAIGSNAQAGATSAVAIGTNSTAPAAYTVSVGSPTLQRRIVYLAQGDVSPTSSDAVTGAQLDTTNRQVTALQDAWNNSGVIDPGTGDTLAVTYSSAAKNLIQLGSVGSPVNIRNVAPAGTPTDAVNLGQMTSAMDELRGELSLDIAYVKVNSTGTDAMATGTDAVAIGPNAIASFDGALALGLNARVSADQAVALGCNSLAGLADTVSVGNGPMGLKRRLVNLQAGANADDAVALNQLQPVVAALGGGAAIDPLTGTVTGPTYTLLNGGEKTSIEDALGALDQAVSESGGNNPYLAINSTGPVAAAIGNDAIALGSGADAPANNAVALGANAVADVADTVSVGRPGGERKLVNVAKGSVWPESTHAVTGAQLYVTNQRLDATDQVVNQLQTALTGSGLIDPVSGTSLAVTYSNASRNIVSLGSVGAPVEIMNVADGIADSDAATVGQVKGLRTELGGNLKYVKVNAAGTDAIAAGANAVAIGSNASTSQNGAVAIGTGSDVSGKNSVALGYNSAADDDDVISVGYPGGERRIVNVADGIIELGSTDAVNGGQLADALGALSARAGILDEVAPNFAIEGVTGDNTASLNGKDPQLYTAMAFGVKSFASGANTAAFGLNNTAAFDDSVAIGVNCGTGADQPYAVAIGSKATTRGSGAIALGAYVSANADYAVAIGTSIGTTSNDRTQALGASSIAIGDTAKDLGVSGIAIGKTAMVARESTSCIAMGTGANVATNLSDAIALGTGASVAAGTNNGGVALGQGALANRGNAVSLGSTTGSTPVGTRQIIHLSAGTQATDAVNVTQLQGVATALGGGAGVGSDGSIMPPTYTVDGTPYANVGAAINAVANLTDPNAVSYDDTAKDTITLDGDDGTLLTNVSPGTVATDSMDAINGTQLYGTAQSVATGLGGGAAVAADGTVTPPSYVTGTLLANDVGTALGNVVTMVNNQLADAGLVDAGRVIAAVTYDGASKNRVTLGGTDATSEVTLSNVAPGDALSDTSTEAVNGAQLYATNQAIGDLAQRVDDSGIVDADGNSLAVTYVDATHTDIELGTTGTPVTVSNVAPGDASSDTSTEAVNGGQLYATNQAIGDLAQRVDDSGIVDADGNSLAVTYVDATHTDIELGTAGTPVTVSNVKEGDVSSDTSTDAVNGGQLYATNQAIADLAQRVDDSGIVDADGNSLAVTYVDATHTDIELGTTGTPVTVSNVAPGDALSDTSTEAVNGGQLYATNQAISRLTDTLNNSGLIDPDSGESLAVTYDDDSKDGVTLGASSAVPVALHNMAAGVDLADGVNVAQLTTGLSDLKTELTSGAINLRFIKVNTPASGTPANANGTSAVSIGSNSSATAPYSVAIGTGAYVSGEGSVAVGFNSDASANDVFSVGFAGGERKIINVAEGDISADSTDAVTGGQLFAVRRALDALTATNSVKNEVADPVAAVEGRSNNNVASLNGGNPEEFTAAAIGALSVASGADAIAVGLHNIAGSNYSVALGRLALTGVDHEYSVAVGADVRTNAARAVAFGTRVQANAEHALALGSNETWAIGRSSIAMGEGVKVRSDNSIAMGRAAMVTANAINALALGAQASVEAGAIGGVALGHGAVADRGNAISIGGGSVGTRQIIHVSAGTELTDAVNVAQLKEAVTAMMAEIQLLRSQLASRPAAH